MKSRNSTQTSVTVTTSKTLVLEASLGRLGFVITNNGSEPVYIGFGSEADTSIGHYLAPKASVSEKSIGFEYAGEMNAVTSSSTSVLAVTTFEE